MAATEGVMTKRLRPARIATPLAIAALCVACQAAGSGSSTGLLPSDGSESVSPVETASLAAPSLRAPSGPSSSPGIAPSICTDTRTSGSVVPSTGTALGHIKQGRILFGIEASGAASSGTFAYAVIDASGFHAVRTTDWTMAHAVWAPDGGIIFDSERSDDRHLFRIAEDGSNVTQLTSDLRGAEQSAAVAAGGRLVFSHYSCSEPRDLGLHTTAIDGSGMTALTPDQPLGNPQVDDQPTVSPDGKTVVFVRFVDDAQTKGGLFSIPLAGGTAKRLTEDAGGVSYPRYSPDGLTILFTRNDDHGDPALWLVDAGGGHPRQLTNFPAGTFAFNGDWSPDGQSIAMEVYSRGWSYNELHAIGADGQGDVVLWRGDGSTRQTAETADWGR
jgi:hypothetical protein